MKVSAYLFLALCTVAVPALAADGPTPALDLGAEPLTSPAAESCDAPLGDVLFAASGTKEGGGSLVTCTADCGQYTDVSCSTTGTCTAVDRNCAAGQRGYVSCNGATTFCPICEFCPEGQYRITMTGNCCDCGLEERIREQCVNGVWVFVDSRCGPSFGNCPWCP